MARQPRSVSAKRASTSLQKQLRKDERGVRTCEEAALRCRVLASLFDPQHLITEEHAAQQYGVSVAEIGAWLEALRGGGGAALFDVPCSSTRCARCLT